MVIEITLLSTAILIPGLIDKLKEYSPEIKNSMATFDALYQSIVQEKIDSLLGDRRYLQLQELSSDEGRGEISEAEKDANRRLGVASMNLGLATFCQVFCPYLLIISIPATFWLSMPRFEKTYISLFEEHKIDVAIIDSILVIWAVLSGYLFASVLGTSLITVSLKLLAKTKDAYRGKLIHVFKQQPHFVWIIIDDTEIEIPFEKLKPNDLVVINAGEMIPIDGIIVNGIASIDQHLFTGESQPVEKEVGDQVFASTIVLSGKIHVQAEKAGQETVAAQLVRLINDTSEYKTSLEFESEQIVNQSVLPTLLLSAIAYPVGGVSGALAILSSCIGYNMRLISPVNTLNLLRIASEAGILIKDGHALEKLAEVDTLVFDKTGTLTLNQLYVSKIHSCNGLSEETLLTYAAAAEYRQKHPIANAILAATHKRNLSLPDIENNYYEMGYGIKVNLSDQTIVVGSERFMEKENILIPKAIQTIREDCHNQGFSLVMVAVDGEVSGAIELHPILRKEATQVINTLKKQNTSIYIVSGDHEQPTQTLARELGVTHFLANMLPEQKAKFIQQLKKEGRCVCFIGDGINDSIALKQADVSISLRGASSVAVDSAQIVLMDEKLDRLTQLIDMCKKFKENQKKNLMISVIPGLINISSVFLLHSGIYTSLLLYYSGLTIGVWNASMPIVGYQNLENNISDDSWKPH